MKNLFARIKCSLMADIDGLWWDKSGSSYDVGFADYSITLCRQV